MWQPYDFSQAAPTTAHQEQFPGFVNAYPVHPGTGLGYPPVPNPQRPPQQAQGPPMCPKNCSSRLTYMFVDHLPEYADQYWKPGSTEAKKRGHWKCDVCGSKGQDEVWHCNEGLLAGKPCRTDVCADCMAKFPHAQQSQRMKDIADSRTRQRTVQAPQPVPEDLPPYGQFNSQIRSRERSSDSALLGSPPNLVHGSPVGGPPASNASMLPQAGFLRPSNPSVPTPLPQPVAPPRQQSSAPPRAPPQPQVQPTGQRTPGVSQRSPPQPQAYPIAHTPAVQLMAPAWDQSHPVPSAQPGVRRHPPPDQPPTAQVASMTITDHVVVGGRGQPPAPAPHPAPATTQPSPPTRNIAANIRGGGGGVRSSDTMSGTFSSTFSTSPASTVQTEASRAGTVGRPAGVLAPPPRSQHVGAPNPNVEIWCNTCKNTAGNETGSNVCNSCGAVLSRWQSKREGCSDWEDYPADLQETLWDAWRRQRDVCRFTLANGLAYVVDFMKEEQTRMNDATVRRDVRLYTPAVDAADDPDVRGVCNWLQCTNEPLAGSSLCAKHAPPSSDKQPATSRLNDPEGFSGEDEPEAEYRNVHSRQRMIQSQEDPIGFKGTLVIPEEHPNISCLDWCRAHETELAQQVPRILFVISEVEMWLQSKLEDPVFMRDCVLDKDELAACGLYTFDLSLMAHKSQNFFYILNNLLRSRNPRTMDTWKPFLYYVTSAMHKIPPWQGVCYRGLPAPHEVAGKDYFRGRNIHWSAFTSASRNRATAAEFITAESGVIFKIYVIDCKDISKYSFYPDEEELLLSPNAKLVVTSEPYKDGDSWFIDLQQITKSIYFS